VAEGGSKTTILSKETAIKLSGDRILGWTILLESLVLQGKPTTMMAMPMAQTLVPFNGATASLGRRKGINLPEDMIHHDTLCNRLTSF
jgi:hypothetical protein